MKNEIEHGKIISVENIFDYEEEYRSREKYFLFGLRERIFVNCIFENIVFDDEWLDKKFYNNIFENCMFFKCSITKNCELCAIDAIPESTNMRCPRYDKIIGYKIICRYDAYLNPCYLLATLEVPAGVKRSASIGNKCRCEYAKVLSITDKDGKEYHTGVSAIAAIGNQLIYKTGEYVYADSFDENRFNECASGIHFFMTPEGAWDYAK